MPAGRPRKFNTPEELEKLVSEYFTCEHCPDTRPVTRVDYKDGNRVEYQEDIPHFTKTGLALYLGFESRQSLYDYANREDEFSYIIKKASLRVENNYEKMLAEKGVQTGAIFALKNMEWKDKTETDITSKGNAISMPTITVDSKELDFNVGDKIED